MPPNLSVKLLIVDDHPLFRQGVRSALSVYDDIDVVADASSGEDAVEWLMAAPPPTMVKSAITRHHRQL